MAHRSDLVLHIDDNLDDTLRKDVEGIVNQRRGVFNAYFNEKRPHLMLVSYDPSQISSFDILSQMNSQHLNTARVG